MTNNDKIKEEATHLLSKIKQFKRTCDGIGGGPKNPAPIDAFERELRLILMIVRTDEENQNQSQQDSYC